MKRKLEKEKRLGVRAELWGAGAPALRGYLPASSLGAFVKYVPGTVRPLGATLTAPHRHPGDRLQRRLLADRRRRLPATIAPARSTLANDVSSRSLVSLDTVSVFLMCAKAKAKKHNSSRPPTTADLQGGAWRAQLAPDRAPAVIVPRRLARGK